MAAGGNETMPAVTEVPSSQKQHLRDVVGAPFPQGVGLNTIFTWRVAQGHPWALSLSLT